MHSAETQVQKFDRSLPLSPRFRTGVSLHSHTMHSREYLGDLPHYLTYIPIVSYIIERQEPKTNLRLQLLHLHPVLVSPDAFIDGVNLLIITSTGNAFVPVRYEVFDGIFRACTVLYYHRI